MLSVYVLVTVSWLTHSIDIKDVFQDYTNLVEFLISLGHLPPHTGRHNNYCLTQVIVHTSPFNTFVLHAMNNHSLWAK